MSDDNVVEVTVVLGGLSVSISFGSSRARLDFKVSETEVVTFRSAPFLGGETVNS